MTSKKTRIIAKQRFYILLFALGLSIIIYLILNSIVSSRKLFIIRLEQVYGFVALAYWYIVFAASPLSKIYKNSKFIEKYVDMRRALGVSVAYFAILHSSVAFFGQLNGFSGIDKYPPLFNTAIILGFVGLVTLLIMAMTSFDKIVDIFGFKNWKMLHRLSYVASYLVLVHVWIIGTHIKNLWVVGILASMTILLLTLESWRMSLQISAKRKIKKKSTRYVIFVIVLYILVSVVAIIPFFITSYSQLHSGNLGH